MAMSQSHPECRIILFTSAGETEMSLCPDLGTACTQWTREPSTHTAVRLWLASVLTHCPAGKALCSGSPPAHLGPSAYPALARPLSTGVFSPLPPLHIATAYVLPNLSASTTVPSRDSCCHASHLRTDFLALSSQPRSSQVNHHILTGTVIWAARHPQRSQPTAQLSPWPFWVCSHCRHLLLRSLCASTS